MPRFPLLKESFPRNRRLTHRWLQKASDEDDNYDAPLRLMAPKLLLPALVAFQV